MVAANGSFTVAHIDNLIADMTLAEKIGQLTMTASDYAVTGPFITPVSEASIRSGAIGNLLNLFGPEHVRRIQKIAVEESRLHIPLLLGFDVIHGHRTIFPIPLAEAGLFDPGLWESTAREAALEATADGLHLTFAPMLDVARDPRWGRISEGPGEDPYLGAAIATAKVRGFQGASLADAGTIAACAKHYCGYGAVTAGREYAPTDISDVSVREVYLPPFASAAKAGVASVMPAFTDLNGVPMTAHAGMLRETLRGELGFDGVIISDYNAIAELINHGVANDLVEAAALALKAGVDIDMMADAYRHGLPPALERGLIRMEDIDAAVNRVLLLKERLGLFDDPYRRGSAPESSDALTRRRAVARDVAARSVVLMKNPGKRAASVRRAPGRDRSAGGCGGGNARSMVGRRNAGQPCQPVGGPDRSAAGQRDPACTRHRHRGWRHHGHPGSGGAVRFRRYDFALHRRSRGDERRSCQPCPSGPAGKPAETGGRGFFQRQGQTRHRDPVLWPAIGDPRYRREGRCRDRGMVSGKRGGQRACRYPHRQTHACGPDGRELAPRCRPGADLLWPAPRRTPLQRRPALHQ